MTHSPTPDPPTVLVTGGCGFLGYHLVSSLLSSPSFGPVYVLDLTTTHNTHPGATYLPGSVTSPPSTLSAILDTVRPALIFHAASPSATYAPRAAFRTTNVGGTRTLLQLAAGKEYVRALVYTSSVDVYADPPHRHVREDHPLWPTERTWPWTGLGLSQYDRTKTIAHRLVLEANDPPRLKTAVIVPAHIWGLRDSQALRLFFETFADPRAPLYQVGRGTNLISTVEAGNCARAHILAGEALLLTPGSPDPDSRVDGEAFNVTDGLDMNFWEDVRATCALIRGHHDDDTATTADLTTVKVKWHVIPAWVMGVVVELAKWLYLILTLGRVEPPPALGRNGLSWCTEEHTMDDTKARRRLGYRPADNDRRGLRAEAVAWERERRGKLTLALPAGQGEKEEKEE